MLSERTARWVSSSLSVKVNALAFEGGGDCSGISWCIAPGFIENPAALALVRTSSWRWWIRRSCARSREMVTRNAV